jgi:Trk K+ transport system NAD-binding subunit
MFDFAPVGAAVAVFGIIFVGLIGWRMVPTRKQANGGSFESGAYISEVRIVEGSKAENKTLREADKMLEESDAQIIGMVRHNVHISAPNFSRSLRAGDILVIEVEPESMTSVLSSLGLKLEEDVPSTPTTQETEEDTKSQPGKKAEIEEENKPPVEEDSEDKAASDEAITQELVVTPNAALVNRSATDIELRTRYGINLLAISRQGQRSIKRLRTARILAGDVLLMHGAPEALSGFAANFGCLPLATRDIRVPKKGQALTASLLMAVAVLAWLPFWIGFARGDRGDRECRRHPAGGAMPGALGAVGFSGCPLRAPGRSPWT